jgi:flavin-dependent dehydrogenase
LLDRTDLFVVGGGPAGLAAAIAASKRGFSVTVADGGIPPINKPCGEGLMPDGFAALKSLGVQLQTGDAHPLRGSRFINGDISAAAQFPRSAGIGIRRTILHQRMIELAESCGVRLLWRTAVRSIERGTVRAAGVLTRAKWIIGADGAQSQVRRWTELDRGSEVTQRFCVRQHFRIAPWSHEVEIYWRGGAQIYVTPLAAEEIGVVVISEKFPLNFAEAIRGCAQLAERLKYAEPAGAPRGAVTVMRQLPSVYRGNVALLGDASGSVDAITGEGLRLAFLQSEALADSLAQNDLSLYQNAHRRLARLPRAMARLLLLLARRPILRRRTIQILAAEPHLFTKLLGVHLGDVPPSKIAATGLALGWRLLTT